MSTGTSKLQQRLDGIAQQHINEILDRHWPDSGLGLVNMAPASISLAALTRIMCHVDVMMPKGISEWEAEMVLHELYEMMDGSEFTVPDNDYFEEGTHTMEYG